MKNFSIPLLVLTAFTTSAWGGDDFTFKIPSSVTVGAGAASSGTKSGLIDARIMLPENFWIGVAFDNAIENTDGLESKNSGGSASIGTDPIKEYSGEIGFDRSGVQDQYMVEEFRARLTTMPDSFFSVSNPGFEASLEIRASRFSFANTPNPIFQNSIVELAASSARLDVAYFGWTPITLRAWYEKTTLADRFKELARPLAPLFVPLTAISTATTWTGEEFGAGIGLSRQRYGLRLSGSVKTASVTGEKTGAAGFAADYRWNRTFTSAVRFAHIAAIGQNSSTTVTTTDGEPIQTYGLDLTFFY